MDLKELKELFPPRRATTCIVCHESIPVGAKDAMTNGSKSEPKWQFAHRGCLPKPEVVAKPEFNAYTADLATQIDNQLREISPERAPEFTKMWAIYRTSFCTSPGAHKRDYHHCWKGGLAHHSLSVLNYALRLADSVGLLGDGNHKTRESITICALFHDLGKADGYYLPVEDDWKRNRGELYFYNKEWSGSHAQRSLYMLQQHVTLTTEEYRAIMLHDGQYVEANRRFSMNEPDLALVIHWADLWDARHADPKPETAEE